MSEKNCSFCEISDSKSLALYWIVRLADMPETVKSAVKEGADKNWFHHSFSLLCTALWYKKFENAHVLLDLEADVNAPTQNDKSTALMIAVLRGREDLVSRLRKMGANKDAKMIDGDDALAHVAVCDNPDPEVRARLVELLK